MIAMDKNLAALNENIAEYEDASKELNRSFALDDNSKERMDLFDTLQFKYAQIIKQCNKMVIEHDGFRG